VVAEVSLVRPRPAALDWEELSDGPCGAKLGGGRCLVIGDTGEGVRQFKGWLLPVLLTGVPFVLVAAQPDLGTSLTFLPILLVALIVAGARLWQLGLVGLAGLIAAPLMWIFVLKPYQKGRILSFLDPAKAAASGAYQQIQSIIAVGSGGTWGKGYEAGTQGRLGFLPERHTDFIFAVIGEEFGLVGGLFVLGLYGALMTALVLLAKRCPDRTGRLMIMGVGTVLFLQVTINVGMNIGCAPITGLTLPFISYGGSSMLGSFLGIALVSAAARREAKGFERGLR